MAASFPIPVKRSFYITLSLLIALIAFVGFWPSYFGPLLSRTVDTETVIHFHVTIYVGWLLIFFTQATFAATGRLVLHRKLGSVGIGYGVLIIIVGLFTTFSRFAGHVAEFGVEESLGRLHWPLTDMVLFSAFFGCAVAYRRKPEIHKRFMIVATTTLLVAAAYVCDSRVIHCHNSYFLASGCRRYWWRWPTISGSGVSSIRSICWAFSFYLCRASGMF